MAAPFRLIFFTSFTPRFWERHDADNGYDWARPGRYVEMSRLLERAGFEAAMFADTSVILNAYQGKHDAYVRNGIGEAFHGDPVPLMAAISQGTSRMGLVTTLSTSLYPPRLLAQVVSSLDHVARGRIGWNIVTSMGKSVAQNFGLEDLPGPDERYAAAGEFVDMVDWLWSDSCSSETRRGTYLEATGPLRLPRMPQGRPVIMQAGGSEQGRNFAAKHADLVISHRNTPEAMRQFRDDMRSRARNFGRDADELKVFFTIGPVVAKSRAEAAAIRDRELAYPTMNVEVGLANLSGRLGFDVSRLPLDEPLPADLAIAGSAGVLQQHTEGGGATLREIALSELVKETYPIHGTPEDVADELEHLMEFVGGDGFAFRATMTPSVVIPLVDQLVPVLQARGLTRTGYRYTTLRENMLDPDFARVNMHLGGAA